MIGPDLLHAGSGVSPTQALHLLTCRIELRNGNHRSARKLYARNGGEHWAPTLPRIHGRRFYHSRARPTSAFG